MKRRLSMFVLLGAALALVVSGCGGTKLSGEKTLKYTEKDTNNFGFADNPPKSTRRGEPELSNGDILSFTADMLDPSSKKKVGRLDAECTVTEGKGGFNKSFATCSGGVTLPGGTLALSVNGDTFQDPTEGAIIGGTGDYAGATGTFTSKTRTPNGNFSDDEYHFFVPKK